VRESAAARIRGTVRGIHGIQKELAAPDTWPDQEPIRKRGLPDGSPGIGAGNSLILQAEDAVDVTVLPRLLALAADLEHIFPWSPYDEADMPLRVPANLDLLEQAIVRTDARLVVIDPVMAFLDQSIIVNSDQSVRRALAPLARLARIHRCLILLVRHLNKPGGFHALYRGGGSIGLLAACRAGLLIGNDPRIPERRVLAQTKFNLAAKPPSLAYELLAQSDGPPTISWLGESPWSARQLLAAAARPPSPERERAQAFLRAFLKDGPRPYQEISAAAARERISPQTLRRAREAIPLRSERLVQGRVQTSYWLLEGQSLPRPASDDKGINDFWEALEAQKRKFPSPPMRDDDEWTDDDTL
jgi:hypothetical protein